MRWTAATNRASAPGALFRADQPDQLLFRRLDLSGQARADQPATTSRRQSDRIMEKFLKR